MCGRTVVRREVSGRGPIPNSISISLIARLTFDTFRRRLAEFCFWESNASFAVTSVIVGISLRCTKPLGSILLNEKITVSRMPAGFLGSCLELANYFCLAFRVFRRPSARYHNRSPHLILDPVQCVSLCGLDSAECNDSARSDLPDTEGLMTFWAKADHSSPVGPFLHTHMSHCLCASRRSDA